MRQATKPRRFSRRRGPGGPRRRVALALLLLLVFVTAACSGSGSGDGQGGGAGPDDDPGDVKIDPGDRAVQVIGAGKVRLFGTLTVPPAAQGATVPAVLLVPTLGPGDRSGPIGPTGVRDGLAQDLAQAFSQAGIASYRYDRRGTAESKLDPGTRLTFDDMVADARAGLDLLAQRKETSGRDLAVVGYDQGGLVALRLAATDERVRRVVLISAPGRTAVDPQAAQLAALYGPESAGALRATVATLLATRTLPPIDELRTELRPLFPPSEAAFLADVYGRDPVVDAARVKAEALIVVPADAQPYDPARLSAALRGAQIVTTTQGGPTLLITGPPPASDPSNPASPTHEHGAGPATAKVDRDAEAIGNVTGFLSAAPASRPPS